VKLAVLSDIHSNYIALKACFDYIEKSKIDGIIYLGDNVSDCPYPQKTLELISVKSRQYKSWFIKGNREEYLINHHYNKNDGWEYSSNNGSLLYTYENLTGKYIEFFKNCENTLIVKIVNCSPITICHGSPSSSRESMEIVTDEVKNYIRNLDTDYLLCGHTHKPYSYSLFNKTIINPGSVGIPTNGQTKSQFAILTWEDNMWVPEFVSIDYDIETLINEFEISGHNFKAKMWSKALIKTLQTGKDYALECVRLAHKLAVENDENLNQKGIPEKYWEQAAKELEI
jgi:putative phosphoesterase